MKRLNLFEMYQCGGAVKLLGRITQETKPSEIQADLFVVDSWLRWLLDENQNHLPIHGAREDAKTLRGFIETFRTMRKSENVGESKYSILKAVFSQFESVLAADLARLQVYSITTLLAYDTEALLEDGKAVLTQSTVDWMSNDAIAGFNEGTRSLALKQATAAGFLLLRAMEGVMHDYYDVLSNGAPRPKRRNMGDYIDALEKVPGVSPEMLEVLRSIKNLRRNPLMHADQHLVMDDAVAIFDVSKSAISAMARQARQHKVQKVP